MTPRAGSDVVESVDDAGRLRVRVRAAPADGAANSAVIRTLADALDVALSRVELVSGNTSHYKRVAISGIDSEALKRRWPGLLTRQV